MATLFISDIHLVQHDASQGRLFEKFLRDRAVDCTELYILGDLFDYWIGDDISPALFAKSITALKQFAAERPVYVMHGNRDFLLGEQFAREIGCQLLSDPTVITLYGARVLVTHGDLLCTDDIDYLKFRRSVRDPAWQRHFLASSAEQRLSTAKNLRAESAQQTKQKADYVLDVNPQAVTALMQQHAVVHMIHGHVHKPGLHEWTDSGQSMYRYVLGDWSKTAQILCCSAQGFMFETIH